MFWFAQKWRLLAIDAQSDFWLFRGKPDNTFEPKLFEKWQIQLVGLARAIQALFDHAEIRRRHQHGLQGTGPYASSTRFENYTTTLLAIDLLTNHCDIFITPWLDLRSGDRLAHVLLICRAAKHTSRQPRNA